MAVNDQIEIVRGNVVGVSSASNGVSDNLSSLSTRLSDELGGVRNLFNLSDAVSADSLIGDSLRCRLQELGGSIMDLIEDGFGLGDLIKDFKMPDLSELGAKLAQLNPLNLLDKLGDISLESVTNKVGELINDAVGFIGDVIDKTFKSVERAMKGIGDMFDEFGDRVVDLGQFVQDTITGIVGGVGQVLQDVTQGIENIVGSLLAPCPKPSSNPSVQAQQSLQADLQMFDTDIEMVHGNIVNASAIATTTGKFSNIVTQQATQTVRDISSTTGASIPLSVDPIYAASTPDAAKANAAENEKRQELEDVATNKAKDRINEEMVNAVENEKKQGEQEETKEQLTTTDESGENVGVDSVFDLDTCTGVLKKFDQQIQRVIDLSNGVVESDKTFFDGSPNGVTQNVSGFWAVTPGGVDSLMLVRTRDGKWHATLSSYPVLQALNILEETGKWPEVFLQDANRNYGVIEPKYLDNLKKAWEISVEMLGMQNLKRLQPCIDEEEEKLKQAAIDSLNKNSPFYKSELQYQLSLTDRTNRKFLIKQLRSFHDRFIDGGEKKLQKWGDTTEYKVDRSSGPLFDTVDMMAVNICPAIAASGSGIFQFLNSSD